MQRTVNQWESELIIISSIQVVIPVKLYLVCNQIAGNVGGNEFSVVTDIKEKDNQIILLTDEFYIPKQKVNPSNIEYLHDVYNHSVCIHRHPDGCNGFLQILSFFRNYSTYSTFRIFYITSISWDQMNMDVWNSLPGLNIYVNAYIETVRIHFLL